MPSACRRTAPDEVDDLDSIALPDYRGIEQGPPDHHEVVLHGHSPAVHREARKEGGNGHWAVELIRFAVEGDGHDRRGVPPCCSVRSRAYLRLFRQVKRKCFAMSVFREAAPSLQLALNGAWRDQSEFRVV
jgi:hypothetical protein